MRSMLQVYYSGNVYLHIHFWYVCASVWTQWRTCLTPWTKQDWHCKAHRCLKTHRYKVFT